MGLLTNLKSLRSRWLTRGKRKRRTEDTDRLRSCRFEPIEPRLLLAASPLFVGSVYIEQDDGSDLRGDTFELTFDGGAPETELTRLVIDGDQISDYGNLAGFSSGDVFFDTIPSSPTETNLGADEALPLTLGEIRMPDGQLRPQATATGSVNDGGTQLVLEFTGFLAGDTLTFSIDVDEVESFDPREVDIDVINDGFDPLTSGAEFQGSAMTAYFSAPHYYDAEGSDLFINRYDRRFALVETARGAGNGLSLPGDDEFENRDRTAGALIEAQQEPLPISISGTVFHDRNRDLAQDAAVSESGIEGVELALWKMGDDGRYAPATHAGQPITTVTDPAGDYSFGSQWHLLPGTYQVRQTQPSTYPISVGATAGTVEARSVGQASGTNMLTDIEIPLGGTAAIDYDFAEARPASISGYVYHDHDNDAVRDSGDEGIGEVRVVAIDATGNEAGHAITDTLGFYLIDDLEPQSYVVLQAHPNDWIDGLDVAGTVERIGQGTLGVGSAVNPGDRIEAVDLLSEEDGVNYNFGERLGSIHGSVFSDRDRDCLIDQDEPGIEGVTIVLTDQHNNTRTTTTDSQGRYRFDDLKAGTYTVTEIQPDSHFHGGQHVGTGTGDATTPNEISGIRIANGDDIHLRRYDFCDALGSLSGYVYHDRDNDGRLEAGQGEEAIAGVTVRLLHADDGRAVTDEKGDLLVTATIADGYYQFTDLAPGLYRIVEQHPNNWLDGIDSPGQVDGVTSGRASQLSDTIDEIDLTLVDPSQQPTDGVNYNFGERLGSIQGSVFSDRDRDCLIDQNEPGIEGVTIVLTDQHNNAWTTTTDSQGLYQFGNLGPGTYTVTETQPASHFHGGQHVGTGSGDATRPNVISGIRIANGDDYHLRRYDFCDALGSLSGYVYHDRDNDGRLEAGQGEEAIANVNLRLLHANDGRAVIGEDGRPLVATTDDDGYYEFTDLAPGLYRIVEQHPNGWLDGIDSPGQVDGITSGQADQLADRIDAVDLTQLDPSQPPRDGVNYNFGERLGSLQGTVYFDSDRDCLRDPDEAGITPATITLLDQDGNRLTTTTNQKGQYRFEDLRPGIYTIIERQPSEFFQGGQKVGTGTGDATVPNVISGVQVGGGDVHLRHYDFCETLGTLSGHVYHDQDDDGSRESGEDPIAGVTVSLLDADGKPVLSDAGKPLTAETDAAGNYQFVDLRPGMYRVVETHPRGWLDGTDAAGTVGGHPVGQAVESGDEIRQIDLSGRHGRDGIDYDFAELLPASIQGIVHTDLNNNCQFEPGRTVVLTAPELREIALSAVTVQLLDASGTVMAETTTDEAGNYRFRNLRPGTYAVREVQPTGLFQGGQRLGTGGGDDRVTDLLSDVPITSGDALTDYDFCETPPASLSGFVFQDGPAILGTESEVLRDLHLMRDGRFDSGDVPIRGVVMQLRDGISGLPVVASQALPGMYPDGPIEVATDARGFYNFEGIPRGNYAVFEVHPQGYLDGIDTPGSTSGVAINRHETKPQFVLNTLVVDPGDDAIVRIPLPAGSTSLENNFSEVRTSLIPPPPDTPDPTPSPPETPRPAHPLTPPDLPIVPLLVERRPADVFYGGSGLYTWHLSVIDAGAPRGTNMVTADDSVWQTSAVWQLANWTMGRLHGGRWIVSAYTRAGHMETHEYEFGIPGATPVTGDFNGDGISELALFYEGEWYLDLNRNGRWDEDDLWARLGDKHDRPVTGDWDGDGKDDIGIFGPAWLGDRRAIEVEPGLPDPDNHPVTKPKNLPPDPEDATSGRRLLQTSDRDGRRADIIDHVFHYGAGADVPVSGDWNGDGISAIGLFSGGQWTLDMDGDGRLSEDDEVAKFGQQGDTPVVGDFDGNGIDDIGVFRAGQWYLDMNGNRELDAHDLIFEMGEKGDTPVVGDFNGDGVDEPATYREAGPDEHQVSD